MQDIKELIEKNGGIAQFAKKYNITYRTVQAWHDGQNAPKPWLAELFNKFERMEEITKELKEMFLRKEK